MRMAKNEKELNRFEINPAYREKVIKRVHKEQDNQYNNRIKQLETEKDKLIKSRAQEITMLANSRWEKIAGGKLLVNHTEGKVKTNQTDSLFSSIKGAELNMQTGYRVVTQETSKSKKHASLGGAAAGGLIFGPIGAVAGGVGLGKTKTKGVSTSNQIPTCNHIGVVVNLSGFISEIVILSRQVDQSSMSFTSAQNEAQNIISQLGALAQALVPQSYLRVEDESSVKNIDVQIEQKNQEIQDAINDRPTYALPEMYRTSEQHSMSDEEYLSYLKSTDQVRQEETIANTKEMKLQKSIQIDMARQQKTERKVQNPRLDIDYPSKAKSIGGVIVTIIFWAFSVFNFIFFLVAITSKSGVASGIVFLITALLINPLLYKLIRYKLFKMPRWVCIIILVVGFIIGIILFPSSAANVDTINNTVTITKEKNSNA